MSKRIAPGASLEPPLLQVSGGRRLTAEALGAAMLLAIVVGSGIMGARLSAGDHAMALLGNALSTGGGLIVLVTVFGPVSGAHFNPAVSLVFALRRELSWPLLAGYVVAQVVGGVVGVLVAHAMFGEPMFQVSTHVRSGPSQVLSEFVAAFGLLVTILGTLRFRPQFTPGAVGLYIASAYWFTASTSFANPAVTVARAFTDTFAGIAPSSVAPFIAAQVIGAIAGWLVDQTLLRPRRPCATN